VGVATREGKPVTRSLDRQPNLLLNSAFPLLLFFLFYVFVGVMDLVPYLVLLRPQLILAILGLLIILGTGQFMKVLQAPIGISIAVFTAWFIASGAFGAWPGGSFGVLVEYWYKSALMYLLAAGLLTTLPQANRIYRTIAYAIAILSVVTLLKNVRTEEGRLILNNTRYANSNDLAWTLLVGLTFIGFLYLRGTRWQKVLAVLMAPPVLLTISRTGSRAGMLGTVALVVVLLIQVKRATRIKLMVVLPIVFLAVLVLLPADLLLRYTTYFGTYDVFKASAMERVRMGAIGSAEVRKQLLIDSLIITLRHPLMGVGPGNFAVVQSELALARGDQRGFWHLTHNTYTQISSEMGVIGLVIYLAFLFNVLRVLNSIIRTRSPSPIWQNLRQLALPLRTAFIVFLPVAFFDSLAYTADVPILAGLATALGFMAQKQRAIDRAAKAPIVAAEPLLEPGLEPLPVGQY
jgi:O-antigen ligase